MDLEIISDDIIRNPQPIFRLISLHSYKFCQNLTILSAAITEKKNNYVTPELSFNKGSTNSASQSLISFHKDGLIAIIRPPAQALLVQLYANNRFR
jgi:hypothetical protein